MAPRLTTSSIAASLPTPSLMASMWSSKEDSDATTPSGRRPFSPSARPATRTPPRSTRKRRDTSNPRGRHRARNRSYFHFQAALWGTLSVLFRAARTMFVEPGRLAPIDPDSVAAAMSGQLVRTGKGLYDNCAVAVGHGQGEVRNGVGAGG